MVMESTPAASASAAAVSQPTQFTGFGASPSEELRERRKKLWEGLESKRCQTDNYATLHDLVKHHIESFDYFAEAGLENALQNIRPIEVVDPRTGGKCRMWFGKPELQWPQRETSSIKMCKPMFPQECRESKSTYRGKLTIEVHFEYNGGVAPRERFHFGYLPIMLMSKRCHLRDADAKKLTSCREEATEMGGYFICGGLERLCRLLILPKGNYPMGILRKSYASRGDGFTDKAVSIRCVREDQSSVTVKLYYLQNGSARVGFWLRMKEFLLPVGVVLKALIDTTDREIYANLTSFYNEKNQKMKGAVGTQLVGERAKIILDEVRDMSLLTHMHCVEHIGECFQPVMDGFDSKSHFVTGEAVLRDFIFVHLGSNHDKFNLLIFMLQKLFALVDQTAAPDSVDALQNQEVLLVGHLLTVFLKEKLELWLERSRTLIQEELVKGSKKIELANVSDLRKLMDKSASMIGRSVEGLVKTGKLSTVSGLDLPQREGLTIPAERLNFLRFLSHFRSVHRGASFAKMRTTSVRKLLPESWGFLCPVHTPDGTPCGLLNHMTATCRVTSHFDPQRKIKDFLKIQISILTILVEMGMIPFSPKLEQAGPPEALHVLLDGRLVGFIPSNLIEEAVAHLRKMKLSLYSSIPDDLEVGYIPLSYGGAYPGLYLFTSPSRLVRPVRNVTHAVEGADIELIGPFEQAYMEIRCPDGGSGGRSDPFPATHEEIHPTGILSVVANLTPWSDHNQSPRNMYQCQMGKQTLGFSAQALQFRADNKSYHLQTPQSPIVRTKTYDKYCMDEFPVGTNAIVAVLAYSGYDMEDAMILNKSSVERGLCRGHIYQTQPVDLEKPSNKSGRASEIFVRGSDKRRTSAVDSDGLPYIAQMINPGETLYTTQNLTTNRTRFTELKGTEPAYVDYVAVDGSSSSNCLQKVNIRLRKPRNPIIGDKFSSRHGQKGVCSQLWPDTDMPFSAVTGMRPDLIINPHAFPSRMTIAMLLESIAAKGGSLSGTFVDATPFASSSKETKDVSDTPTNGDSFDSAERKDSSEPQYPLDNLGPLLASYGFNYHGLEVMYSGVLGTELVFEIFIGPVYYQRLRHMVSDKYQVRSTGTIDQITKQPIGGRKRGGGIRFGEMERDAMLAHGAAYLLHDRLHTCSDYHIAEVCSQCGSVLTSSTVQHQKRAVREMIGLPPARAPKAYTCVACKTSKGMETVAMPYVFRYLTAELAAMNIKVSLQLNDGSKV